MPTGDLAIEREYTCGCIIYRDPIGQTYHETGLFCPSRVGNVLQDSPNAHKRTLVQGAETQAGLFR
jgi:hypothetical protein